MKHAACAGLLLLLAACSGASEPGTPANPLQTAPQESQSAPARPDAQDEFFKLGSLDKDPLRSKYQIAASLDYGSRHLWVEQQLDYLNSSETSLDELLLIAEPQRLSANFNLSEIALSSGEKVQDFDLADGLLRIPLAEPLAPAERLALHFSYDYAVPARQAVLGCTGMQCNFADWYFFVPPYDDERGWLAHPPAAVGEHLAYESADFRVAISVLDENAGIEIATPTLEEELEGIVVYELANARRFAWSASDQFEMLKSASGEPPLRAYVFDGHQAAGEAALEVLADSLALYTNLFGDYPYPTLTIVEADFPDGMESDGLFFLYRGFFEGYDGGPENYLTTLSAHEVAHNWWFGAVGSDQAAEPWLDEALAAYSELLYYERHHSELVEWWWEFRIRQYDPIGWVDSSIYDHDAFAPYVHAVYFRGAEFLEALRQRMGDEAFFDFLNAYAAAYRGQLARGKDFFSLLKEYEVPEFELLRAEFFQR